MKTNLDHPLTYFILGLPRSGTTIVASFFNSLDDGFCLGEPHWYVETGHPVESVGPDCCGKVARFWDTDDVVTGFIPRAMRDSYHLGGYKETWRGDDLGKWLLHQHLPLVDFFVLVHRPAWKVYVSQMARNWPADEWTPRRAVQGARLLRKLGTSPKAVNIEFEDFRADPLGHVNRALAGRFEIEGPVALQPTGWVFGDPVANKSTEVI